MPIDLSKIVERLEEDIPEERGKGRTLRHTLVIAGEHGPILSEHLFVSERDCRGRGEQLQELIVIGVFTDPL